MTLITFANFVQITVVVATNNKLNSLSPNVQLLVTFCMANNGNVERKTLSAIVSCNTYMAVTVLAVRGKNHENI